MSPRTWDLGIEPQDHVPALLWSQRGNEKSCFRTTNTGVWGKLCAKKTQEVVSAALNGFPRQVSPCPESKACVWLGWGSFPPG